MSSRDPLPSAVPWLLRVSLASVGVQALALAGAHIGALPYAYGTAAACFVGMALAHAPLLGTRTLTTPRNVGLFLGVQVSLFTVALAATGGPSNPFSVLYLVYVASAALALGGRWAAGFAVVTTVAYGSLFPLTEARGLHAIHHAGGFVGHLVGMWLAYALSAALVAYFLVRALAALAAKEADLELLRERASRQGKLLALGQLAAGAAHELGTPLATIAVVAKELERSARIADLDAEQIGADATLLREQAERCRQILEKMGARSGAAPGEAPEPLTFEALRGSVDGDLAVTFVDGGGFPTAPLPRRAIAQALQNLAKNASDASPTGRERPTVYLAYMHSTLFLRVEDDGDGVPPSVRARLGEPFMTTKGGPDEGALPGMGLGLFLVQSLADHLGGSFSLEERRPRGTTATLEIPGTTGV